MLNENLLLQGELISIRYFKDSDLNDYFEIVSDEQTTLYEFRSALKMDEAREELSNKIFVNESEYKTDFFLAIESVALQRLVGELTVHYIDPEQSIAMIGFAINPKHWRQGFATEMLKLFLNYHFENGGLRVFCSTSGENNACINLLTKAGFVKEGQLRKSIWAKDKIWDEVFFGILREEWGVEV